MPAVKVAAEEELPEGTLLGVDAGGTELMLGRVGGTVYCLEGLCNHGLAYLADGDLEGHEVVCPLHGGAFDLRTGAATRAPCHEALKSYPVRIEGRQILVELE